MENNMTLMRAAHLLDENILLTEDDNSKATKKCKNMIIDKIKTKKYGININNKVEDSEGNQADDARTWVQTLEYRFRQEVLRPAGIDTALNYNQRFEPGLMRIAIQDCNWPRAGKDDKKIKTLAAIHGIIFLHHLDEYQMDLPGETYDSLCRKFANEIPAELARQKELYYAQHPDETDPESEEVPPDAVAVSPEYNNPPAPGGIRLNANDYTIESVDTWPRSSVFRAYTNWCLTGSEGTYNNYRRGGTRIYFVQKRGFENMARIHGQRFNDAYSLSLMCIQINPNGTLKYCTGRYNHGANGCPNTDRMFNDEQLCGLFGIRRLSDLFPPFNEQQLRAMGIVRTTVASLKRVVDENPDKSVAEIFRQNSDYRVYERNGATLVIKNAYGGDQGAIFFKGREILNGVLYKNALPFKGNHACVLTQDDRCQIIDSNGDVCNTFDAINVEYPPSFETMDIIKVTFNKKRCNLFNMETGKFLFNKTFEDINIKTITNDGIQVKIGDEWSYVNMRGKAIYTGKNYKYVIPTKNKHYVAITNDNKIDIINSETHEVNETNYKTSNEVVEKLQCARKEDLFKFNRYNTAQFVVYENGHLVSILVKTNGQKCLNKSYPVNLRDGTFNSGAVSNLPGVSDVYRVCVRSNADCFNVINSKGRKLIPGTGLSRVDIFLNTALVHRRNYLEIYNLKTFERIFTARQAFVAGVNINDNSIRKVFEPRFMFIQGIANIRTGDRVRNGNGVYDCYKQKFILTDYDDVSPYCGYILPPYLTGLDNFNRYLVYSNTAYGTARRFGIYDINRNEKLLSDNDRVIDFSPTMTGVPGVIMVRVVDTHNVAKYNFIKLDTEGLLLDHPFDSLGSGFNGDGIATVVINNRNYFVNLYGDMSQDVEAIQESARIRRSNNMLNERNRRYFERVNNFLD